MIAVPDAVLRRAVTNALDKRGESIRHLVDTLCRIADKIERDPGKQITPDILRLLAESLAECAEDLCVDSIAVSEAVLEAAGEDDVDREATGQSDLFPTVVTDIEA